MARLLAIILLLAPPGAIAIDILVPTKAPNCPPGNCLIFLRVGPPGQAEQTVTFSVLPAQAGTGLDISGDAPVEFLGFILTSGNNREGVLIADSSAPLTSGANTIPMSSIGWTVESGSAFPAGFFDDAATQEIYRFPVRFFFGGFNAELAFFYNNDQLVPAGNYSSTVVYTLTLP